MADSEGKPPTSAPTSPPPPASEGRETGEARPEDQLTALICAYDDALSLGLPLTEVGEELPSDYRGRFQRAKECVDLLNNAFRNEGLSRLSTDQFGLDDELVAAAPTGPIPGIADGPYASQVEAAPPSIQIPGFQILGPIGRGGMGIVFRAIQLSLNREVALKVLRPEFLHDSSRLRRFRNEAKVAASLTDSSLLPLIDVIEFGGVPIMIMPYVEGTDLARILGQRREIWLSGRTELDNCHPWAMLDADGYQEVILPVLDRVVRAVGVLHSAGVIHRDIKPSNVLIDRGGNVWVTDFGLARLIDDASVTREGGQLGTPGYMSPEQWDGCDDLDPRADVFGLGATIYQALTLELPYGSGRIQADSKVARPPSRIQSGVNGDHDLIILKAIEPDRESRYDSAVGFGDDWRLVRGGRPPRASRQTLRQRWLRTARRHPWRVVEFVVWTLIVLELAYRACLPHRK